MSRPEILVESLTKRFGSFTALAAVTFACPTSTITSIVGPNGAGKSTLLNVLSGAVLFQSGRISLFGEVYRPKSPKEALAKGVMAIHQEQSLIDDWHVWEHFYRESRYGILSPAKQLVIANTVLRKLGASIDARRYVRDLNTGERQFVEIAKALAQEPRVLLVDEPTVGLDRESRTRIFAALRVAANAGCTVLVVSHDLGVVLENSDSVVLMKEGRIVFHRPIADITLGDIGIVENSGAGVRDITISRDDPLISVYAASTIRNPTSSILTANRCSILGIAAHALSNASELCRAISNISSKLEVQVDLDRSVVRGAADVRFRKGIAYVSRERTTEWLFEEQSVERNLNAASYRMLSRNLIMRRRAEKRNAENLQSLAGIGARSLSSQVTQLSGGNRQKVVLARAVSAGPTVLLMDEPFSGVDAQTRSKLRGLLRDFVNQGKVAIVFSRELDELALLCDSVATFSRDADIPSIVHAPDISAEKLALMIAA